MVTEVHRERKAAESATTAAIFTPKFTLTDRRTGDQFGELWYQCPFDSREDAERFRHALRNCDPRFEAIATAWSEGKERDIEAARSVAIWPDATAEQLSDRGALIARLPALMADFKRCVESFGFTY